MKKRIGITLIIIGVILGLYIGVWLCFVSGIAGMMTELKADEVSNFKFGLHIAKILFAGPIGILSGCGPVFIGLSLLPDHFYTYTSKKNNIGP